jgi:hypothetical protein
MARDKEVSVVPIDRIARTILIARRQRVLLGGRGGRRPTATRRNRNHDRMNASRSGLMVSACVVHMPCGRPG